MVGLDVVEVAAACVALTVGEHAAGVAEDDQVAHPAGWVVGVDGVGAVAVEDGADGDVVGAL